MHGPGNRVREVPAVEAALTADTLPSRDADLREAGIETLARLAARLAGKDPDEHATIKIAKVVAFDDVVWRYPDFITRAEAAFSVLEADRLPD